MSLSHVTGVAVVGVTGRWDALLASVRAPLCRRGNPENPGRGEGLPLGESPASGPPSTKCAVSFGEEEVLFFFYLLFNILKCNERINEARLFGPYVLFSAACA